MVETTNPLHPAPASDIREVFDRQLLRTRRARIARKRISPHPLLETVARDLEERAGLVNRDFATGLLLSRQGTALGQRLLSSGKLKWLIAGDPCHNSTVGNDCATIVCDEEILPFAAKSLDIVFSLFDLHWVNDLPGALVQIRRALKPDGLFLAGLAGGDTLCELRSVLLSAESDISGGAGLRVAPFADMLELGRLMQRAGFTLPVVDRDIVKVRYPGLQGLTSDLRSHGMSNVLAQRVRTPLTPAVLARAEQIYQERFADSDGRLPATFEVIYLTGWAPDPSQPKPLRPGSAKARMADALGVPETPLKR